MSKPASPPPAPDPNATINAQTAANKSTALTNYETNATNQVTPYGSQTYNQTGTFADGTPQFTLSTSLSPQEQQLFNQQTGIQSQFNTLAGQQLSKLGGILGTPVDLSENATEARLMQLGQSRLDPIFQQRQAALNQQLANQGITPGSDAWKIAQTQFGQNQNDAYNQLLLQGHQQGVSDILAERNQPINEISALFGGGQVQQPQFGQTPQVSVAPTNVAGITQDAYQNSLVPWQADNQYNQALMGGAFGLAGAGLGGWARGGFSMPKFGTT